MADFKPAYLLLGPEEGQKADFIRDELVKIRTAYPEGVEEHRYRVSDKGVNELISLMLNGSLFSPAMVVIYRDVDELGKEDAKRLAAYLKSPNPNCVTILVSTAFKVDESLQAAVPRDAQKIYYELFESQRRGWLIGYFRNRGFTLEEDAADFFIEMVGNTTDQLRAEADRLMLFLEGTPVIATSVLEEYLQHLREESPFTLFDALLERRLDSSLEILNKIYLSGENQLTGLTMLLVRQWRVFYLYLEQKKAGVPDETAFQELRIFVKRQKEAFKRAASAFTPQRVEELYLLTQEFDLLVRQAAGTEKKTLLDYYCYLATSIGGVRRNPIARLSLS